MRQQFSIVLSARDTYRASQILQVVNSCRRVETPNHVPRDLQLCDSPSAETTQELMSQYVGSASRQIIVASFHDLVALGRPSLSSPFWNQKCERNGIWNLPIFAESAINPKYTQYRENLL
jgi:hypothetical protein